MVKYMVQQLAYERQMFEVNHDHFVGKHREIQLTNQLNMLFEYVFHLSYSYDRVEHEWHESVYWMPIEKSQQ
jgi:hypothetical protein